MKLYISYTIGDDVMKIGVEIAKVINSNLGKVTFFIILFSEVWRYHVYVWKIKESRSFIGPRTNCSTRREKMRHKKL
ncbi:hypothetical protein U0L90_12785 [Flavobacteriaceae sp. LMIT009]